MGELNRGSCEPMVESGRATQMACKPDSRSWEYALPTIQQNATGTQGRTENGTKSLDASGFALETAVWSN